VGGTSTGNIKERVPQVLSGKKDRGGRGDGGGDGGTGGGRGGGKGGVMAHSEMDNGFSTQETIVIINELTLRRCLKQD
jgi:hypothetical protein